MNLCGHKPLWCISTNKGKMVGEGSWLSILCDITVVAVSWLEYGSSYALRNSFSPLSDLWWLPCFLDRFLTPFLPHCSCDQDCSLSILTSGWSFTTSVLLPLGLCSAGRIGWLYLALKLPLLQLYDTDYILISLSILPLPHPCLVPGMGFYKLLFVVVIFLVAR